MTLKALLLAVLITGPVSAQTLRPDQLAFRDLFKEMVETDTTLSAGSCTLGAEKLAVRLKAAGVPASDITLFADPAFPREGGIVAILPGTDKRAKPILLLGHLDVVEAKRADWTRDPFVMVDEGGY
jgi:acetylornithine deacetylase/succinyl-diaminopimelate desuccinylase-like protein